MVKRRDATHAAALIGMALTWTTVLTGQDFPAYLMRAGQDDASMLPFLTAHVLALLACCAGALALRRRLARTTLPSLAGAASLAGLLGAFAVKTADPSSASGVTLAAAGCTLLAVYAVLAFVAWSSFLLEAGAVTRPADVALSYALSSVVAIACSELGLRGDVTSVAFPLVQAALAVMLVPTKGLVRRADDSGGHGEGTEGEVPTLTPLVLMATLALAFVLVGTVVSLLFGTGAGAHPVDSATSLRRRLVLEVISLVVFLVVAALLQGAGSQRVALLAALGMLSVLFVAELLSSPFALQASAEMADLPALIGTAGFQVFAWLSVACAVAEGRVNKTAAVPVYLAAAVALPKLVTTLAKVSGAVGGLAPGESATFLWSAGAAMLVVAAWFSLVGALALRPGANLVADPLVTRNPANGKPALIGERDAGDGADAHEGGCSPETPEVRRQSQRPADLRRQSNRPADLRRQSNRPADLRRQSNRPADLGLSHREAEVFELLRRGYTARSIADTLCVAESTVQSHAKRIYSKLGVHSKQELIERFGPEGR